MAKSPETFRSSEELKEVVALRWKQLGYRNKADYLKSLIRYDALVGGEDHAVTRPITHQTLEEQDRIDREILSWVKEGKKGRGVLLDKMIDEAIARGAKTPEEVKREIGKSL